MGSCPPLSCVAGDAVQAALHTHLGACEDVSVRLQVNEIFKKMNRIGKTNVLKGFLK